MDQHLPNRDYAVGWGTAVSKMFWGPPSLRLIQDGQLPGDSKTAL
jgi:hypothetical protein